jgi:hypothetical protein
MPSGDRIGAVPRSPILLALAATAALARTPGSEAADRMFDQDLALLRKHVDVVLLEDGASGARVAVVPAWQGRVMTSALSGSSPGFGWINEELGASGALRPHINAFGGEDRLWLGPEGGQFSIYFEKGVPFDLEHWQTPPIIDTEPWAVAAKSGASVRFRHRGRLVNYSGTALELEIERSVRLLSREDAAARLGGALPAAVRLVAFASENTLGNAGKAAWTRETGALSVWILGMFQPSPQTTIVVPYRTGPEADLGPVVNDTYFGKVPADRLVAKDGVLFFSGDGRHRSKIGVSPRRARPLLGSYDAKRGALTIVEFDRPEGASAYVNSMWEIQKDPFAGDVVNSYNDGPPAPGAKPMGPFYELETSSPAAFLAPGARLTHVHRTFHLEGPEQDLDAVARRVLGVPLAAIRDALP